MNVMPLVPRRSACGSSLDSIGTLSKGRSRWSTGEKAAHPRPPADISTSIPSRNWREGRVDGIAPGPRAIGRLGRDSHVTSSGDGRGHTKGSVVQDDGGYIHPWTGDPHHVAAHRGVVRYPAGERHLSV